MSSAASTSLHPLITQALVETKKFFCPFLERGYCREASRCNFSHDNRASIKIPTDYCHFYLANQCLYGQDCKFRHSEPATSDGQTTLGTSGADNDDEDEDEPPVVVVLDDEGQFISADDETQQQQQTPYVVESQEFEDLSYRFSSSLPSIPSSSTSDNISENTIINNNNNNIRYRTTSSLKGEGGRPLTSYAKICKGKNGVTESSSNPKKDYPLCPYSSAAGICQFPPGQCSYLHGLDCDLCGRGCLHPYNLDQQRQHREDCLREHEREMELSFAVQRSKDKVCGICMDTVVEKKPITSSRFGILEKCNHIFCLDCIRKWRGTKQFETRTIRACPECRVSSDFVVPSKYWVEDQDDKEKLINDYKAALRAKPCKYFDEGKGECPFAGSCFYQHAYPDGRIAKLDTPKPRRKVYGARGPTATVANYILWNILTSTDDDDWSNDDLESLYGLEHDFGTTDDEDLQDDDDSYYPLSLRQP